MKILAALLALSMGIVMASPAPALARKHHHAAAKTDDAAASKSDDTAAAKTDDAASGKTNDAGEAKPANPAGDQPDAEGNVLPSVNATLQLGNDYYLMNGDDARQFLGAGSTMDAKSLNNILGLILPTGKSASDTPWYGVITFDRVGWVSDDELKGGTLKDLVAKAQTPATAGNGTWVQEPVYDPNHHSIIWAQAVSAGSQGVGGIDYEIRVLARSGVLGINILCPKTSLADVQTAAPVLASAVSFGPGARYEDYQPGEDAKAPFGLAELVTSYLSAGVSASAEDELTALTQARTPEGNGKRVKIILCIVVIILAAGIAGVHRLFRRT